MQRKLLFEIPAYTPVLHIILSSAMMGVVHYSMDAWLGLKQLSARLFIHQVIGKIGFQL